MRMNTLFTSILQTPIGNIEIRANENAIISILFLDDETHQTTQSRPMNNDENKISLEAKQQLTEYFNATRKNFDLPLQITSTVFQQKVWQQLQTIPFGKTISYLQLAQDLGDEKCIRAAASANGKNPFAIVIPCHRVIGKDGSLTGYAGGLWRKKWLLEHEGNLQKQVSLF